MLHYFFGENKKFNLRVYKLDKLTRGAERSFQPFLLCFEKSGERTL